MNAEELQLQKDITMAFILADAFDVVLERRDKMPDGAGGFEWTAYVPLAPQTARLIPHQGDRMSERSNQNGQMPTPIYVILMEVGSDLERYDQFEWHGQRWEISEVHNTPAYELKGDVVRVR